MAGSITGEQSALALHVATTAMQDAMHCALQGEHRSNPAFRIPEGSDSSTSPTNRSFELARLML
jgi:hypothetical protein